MKLNLAIAVITALITLGSCSGVKNISEPSATQLNGYTEGVLSYKSQFRFKYLFFEAQRLKTLEEFDQASLTMEQCLAIDPSNADAHYEMAQLYVRTERIEDALFHAQQSKNLNPNNIWTLQLLSQLYQVTGDFEGELETYKELTTIDPSNIEYQYLLAVAYSEIKNYKKALHIYDDLEAKIGINEDLSIMKERLYIMMGELDLAAAELKKLIDAFPDEIDFRGMLAELYQANDLNEKAINIYKEILSIDPKESRANMALAEYFRLKKDYLKAFEYLNFSFEDPEFDVDIMFQILSSYFQLALDDDERFAIMYFAPFVSLIDKAIANHPNQGSFHALSGDFYFQKTQNRKAFNAYGKSLDLGLSDFLIWNRYLILGVELQEYELVYSKGLRSIELHPVQPTLYLFTGIACSANNEKGKAIDLWNKGLNYVVNNRPLKAEFYSYLGDAYHNLGDHKASDTNYEKSLALIPENPVVLNNYSYYLSLRSKDLEKAERLSNQCLELSPNEPTYQDTYGWILYKLGRFVEAEEWIKKAIEARSNSSEILEHYGDVLFQINRKAEALKYWKKAKQTGGSSELLNKKAREGILYE